MSRNPVLPAGRGKCICSIYLFSFQLELDLKQPCWTGTGTRTGTKFHCLHQIPGLDIALKAGAEYLCSGHLSVLVQGFQTIVVSAPPTKCSTLCSSSYPIEMTRILLPGGLVFPPIGAQILTSTKTYTNAISPSLSSWPRYLAGDPRENI